LEKWDRATSAEEKERSAAVETRVRRIADAKTETSQRLAQEKRSLEEQAAAARATIQEDADVLADRIAATVLKG
jgi:hypothetical protein